LLNWAYTTISINLLRYLLRKSFRNDTFKLTD